ncbi:MAG: hypothetical protein PHP23_12350 [Desulfobacterales bacterium]|nr:hypothetical protein [Desulfobacterales bacterium]MDD4391997.1 hypothetical protein [Desulfobacterales bacterium]
MAIIRGKFSGIRIWLAVGLICLAAGCGGSFFSYQGRTVPLDQRIELKPGSSGPQQWTTADLTLTYTYIMENGRIGISGAADLAERYQYTFHAVENFFLSVHFLDPEGRVQKSIRLVSSEYYAPIQQMKFNRHYSLPPGTTSVTFSYRGALVEGGTDRTGWNFWHNPF